MHCNKKESIYSLFLWVKISSNLEYQKIFLDVIAHTKQTCHIFYL